MWDTRQFRRRAGAAVIAAAILLLEAAVLSLSAGPIYFVVLGVGGLLVLGCGVFIWRSAGGVND